MGREVQSNELSPWMLPKVFMAEEFEVAACERDRPEQMGGRKAHICRRRKGKHMLRSKRTFPDVAYYQRGLREIRQELVSLPTLVHPSYLIERFYRPKHLIVVANVLIELLDQMMNQLQIFHLFK